MALWADHIRASKTVVLLSVFSGMPQKNYEALGLTGATSKEGTFDLIAGSGTNPG